MLSATFCFGTATLCLKNVQGLTCCRLAKTGRSSKRFDCSKECKICYEPDYNTVDHTLSMLLHFLLRWIISPNLLFLNETLLRSIRYNPHHVFHHLSSPPKNTGHNLRQRSHNFTLHTPVTKQNYLHRMLFLDMYWVLLTTLTLYHNHISPIFIVNLTFYRIYELKWLYHGFVFYHFNQIFYFV